MLNSVGDEAARPPSAYKPTLHSRVADCDLFDFKQRVIYLYPVVLFILFGLALQDTEKVYRAHRVGLGRETSVLYVLALKHDS